ncbi:MAG: helix-turn-helix domain-containing protein [Verrucomicrobiales bacterium]|jgi:transcriptional regulator with XRE-family HTH domain|nr:helix-turn-helix domain-containing protein [Verrucomicrobiales bacterium]
MEEQNFRSFNVVGPQVRKIRNQQAMTQAKLAQKCQLAGWDISREGIAKIESGLRNVFDREIILLAKVLKVHFSRLFPGRLK